MRRFDASHVTDGRAVLLEARCDNDLLSENDRFWAFTKFLLTNFNARMKDIYIYMSGKEPIAKSRLQSEYGCS